MTVAKPHLICIARPLELKKFCTGSNSTCEVTEVCNDENLQGIIHLVHKPNVSKDKHFLPPDMHMFTVQS